MGPMHSKGLGFHMQEDGCCLIVHNFNMQYSASTAGHLAALAERMQRN